MTILLTGGSGALGRELASEAVQVGHVVRIASRRGGPAALPAGHEWAQLNLETSEGLSAAVGGADAIIHGASDPRNPEKVDVEGTRSLVAAARNAGTAHLIYVSIVGLEHIPVKYYRAKLTAEEIVESSGVPYSVLRATQFHTFLDQILSGLARVPLILPVPARFRFQSVATRDVAQRLVRAAAEGPGGRLPDYGGPEVLEIETAAEQWKRARAVRKPLVSLPIPGAAAAALRAGKNTVDRGDHGRLTWSEWLSMSARSDHQPS